MSGLSLGMDPFKTKWLPQPLKKIIDMVGAVGVIIFAFLYTCLYWSGHGLIWKYLGGCF